MNEFNKINNLFKVLDLFAKKLYPGKYIIRRIEKNKKPMLEQYLEENSDRVMMDLSNFFGHALTDEKVKCTFNDNENFETSTKLCSLVNSMSFIKLNKYFSDICFLNDDKLSLFEFIVYFHVVEHIYLCLLNDAQISSKPIDSFLLDKKSNTDYEYYFRGQSDWKWSIVPSFCRNINIGGITLVDKAFLDKAYKSARKIEKYENIMNKSFDKNYYEFLSFMQHSIAYSPLVDFTESSYIGLSFALQSNSLNYYSCDSSLYVLKVDRKYIFDSSQTEKVNYILNHYSFLNIGKNTWLYSVISNPIWINYISGASSTKMYVINIKTNDRMKYQKGVFVLFDKFILIGDQLIMTDYLKSRFGKIRIDTNDKDRLMKTYIESTHNEYRYLMDPYLYLNEPNYKK